MKDLTYGVALARLQPIHNGHLYLIEKILEECDYCVCILGSADKYGTERNPFNIELRMKLFKDAIKHLDTDRIIFFELPDWENENNVFNITKWGHYLYYNIVSRTNQKYITFYYSDSPEYLKSWFDDEIKEYVSFRFLEREHIKNNVSATRVRQAILENNFEYLKENLPKNILGYIPQLKEILLNIKQDYPLG